MEKGASLRRKTTFRIGGAARWCVTVQLREHLVRLVHECTREGIPWFLLGGGSNVLFSDRGFDGVVLVNKIRHVSNTVEGSAGCARNAHHTIEAAAGLELMEVVRFAESQSLSGFEALAGIPGSVGGGLAGNAGAFGRNIGELVESVDLLTQDGEVARVKPETLEFEYRDSRLKRSGEVALSIRFRLAPGDRERISSTIHGTLALREEKHPPHEAATAGSYFKNLPPEVPGGRRIAAGLVLDRAGARELSVGDAYVFEKHANIVVNRGNATARDVLELTGKMKRLAYSHAGVVLEEEVRRIGFSEEELALAHSGPLAAV